MSKNNVKRIRSIIRAVGKNKGKKIDQKSMKVDYLAQLSSIYIKQGWDVIMAVDTSSYNCFRRMLARMTDEEKALILDLTKRFTHWPQDKYREKLLLPLQNIRAMYGNKTLYFARCIANEEDLKKNKSCEQVFYLFKGSTLSNYIDLRPYKVVKDIARLNYREINADKAVLVLVDDFIGTGETAMNALKYVQEKVPGLTRKENVHFLAIIAMRQGLNTIEDSGCHVSVNKVCTKGISDYYKDDDLSVARDVMMKIERKLNGKLEDEFKFGYMQSEGLVCMERCPNNTFPVYWLKDNDAPYER